MNNKQVNSYPADAYAFIQPANILSSPPYKYVDHFEKPGVKTTNLLISCILIFTDPCFYLTD